MRLLEKIERSILRMIDTQNGCIGWDDVLTDDGQEFVELPEGDLILCQDFGQNKVRNFRVS